jgi:hypothetical protein
MGTPIPPEPEPLPVPPGDRCALCWGPGKTFGDVDTPAYVIATISGVAHGEFWIEAFGEVSDGEYILTQLDGYPCFFEALSDMSYIMWEQTRDYSVAWVTSDKGVSALDISISPCETFFFNGTGDYFAGGSLKITIPETT